jgi:hypothetical protein
VLSFDGTVFLFSSLCERSEGRFTTGLNFKRPFTNRMSVAVQFLLLDLNIFAQKLKMSYVEMIRFIFRVFLFVISPVLCQGFFLTCRSMS